MKNSNRMDEEDFDYQEQTTLEVAKDNLNQHIYNLEDEYESYDVKSVNWFYDKLVPSIPTELLAAYILREITNTEAKENGEVEIKHIGNLSDDLSEKIKKYKPMVVELDKLYKTISKPLHKEGKLLIIDSQFTSFLGENLSKYLTGTKAREARRNVDSLDEIEEILMFLSDVSCIDWERLSFDLQKKHNANQPIKWTQIKSNLANHLEECITALHPIKCDKARINKLSTFIINNIITDSSIMTQIRSNRYYAELSAVKRLKSSPVPKRQVVKDTNDRIRP